jgi:hypothetical protein
MPEIRLTDAQLERLEAVRAELEAEFVVGYGHVRTVDAVDYLLDTYTPPADQLAAAVSRASYDELQAVAATVEGVPGSGIGKEEMRERLVEALGTARLAGRLSSLGTDALNAMDGDAPGVGTAAANDTSAASMSADGVDTETDGEGSFGDAEADADGEPADGESTGDGSVDDAGVDGPDGTNGAGGTADTGVSEGSDTDTDDDADTDTTTSGGGSPSPPGGGGSPLQRVARLLEDNDDVWRESSGDTKYEVDLPDGTTEPCRTRDDVKRLLFKHYR